MKKFLFTLGLLILWQLPLFAQFINNEQMSILPNTIVFSNESFTNAATGKLLNDGNLYLIKDLRNEGDFSFSSNSQGTTYFNGKNVQQISGQSAIRLVHTVFDNPQGFELSTTVNFFKKVDFIDGIITVQPTIGIPVFEENAIANNASNSSFIIGKTIKNGTTDFEYPIGRNSQYRSAKISSLKTTNQMYSGEFFEANSNDLYPHSNRAGIIKEISTTEYWEVSSVGGVVPIVLTLSFENATSTDAIVREPLEALRIVRWDVSTQKWVDEGGIVDKDKLTITTPYEVSGFSIFTIGRTDDIGIISPCNKLAIYNFVSPNEDGINDFFRIDGLVECGLANSVEIFNRWGRKVYSTKNYGSASNFFSGISNCNLEDSKDTKVPNGTYFYVLKIGDRFSKSGYLFMN
ncbi:gliding motility-associated C-terminal domain-containing protein [Flavobacterium sp. 9R]|uniref:gliding motility-associated C-terminal domain-containing protein n=1 Tax=Flavobacterium sp. 9R TaxID=2653143 RepID=UPI00135A6DFB|nr:gliding motility-associated C-terminal domain-containing protein [Flavobacterium sp. 9R]